MGGNDKKTERFQKYRTEDPSNQAKPAKKRSFKVSPGVKESLTESLKNYKGFLDRNNPESSRGKMKR